MWSERKVPEFNVSRATYNHYYKIFVITVCGIVLIFIIPAITHSVLPFSQPQQPVILRFYDQSFIKRSFLWGGGWGSYISSQQNLPTLLSVTTRCQITPLLSSIARCYPRRLHVADLFSHVWALRTEMRYLFFLEILTSE